MSEIDEGYLSVIRNYETPPIKGNTDSYLAPILKLYSQNKLLIKKASKKVKFFTTIILVLSVITSGSLWLLLSKTLPEEILWIGAGISTIITGLSLYLKSSGLEAKKRQALATHGKMSEFIANVRSGIIQPGTQEFWMKIKMFENELVNIDYSENV